MLLVEGSHWAPTVGKKTFFVILLGPKCDMEDTSLDMLFRVDHSKGMVVFLIYQGIYLSAEIAEMSSIGFRVI